MKRRRFAPHDGSGSRRIPTVVLTSAPSAALGQENSRRLRVKPMSLDDLTESFNLMRRLKTDAPQIKARFGPLQEQYKMLHKFEVHVSEQETLKRQSLSKAWLDFEGMLGEVK